MAGSHAGRLSLGDIQDDQDLAIADCLAVFVRQDLTREQKREQTEAILTEHLGRVRDICTRRIEAELLGLIRPEDPGHGPAPC